MIARAAAVVLMLPAAVMAQEGPTQADFAAAGEASRLSDSGRYLDAANRLRPLAFGPDGKPKFGFIYDRWSEMNTLMTNEPVGGEPVPIDDADARAMADKLAAATPRDALAEIVARAAHTRVVILNENHGLPRNRAFALEVARALRPLGYSVLAAETFVNDADQAAMTRLARIGYPTLKGTGHYTRDPVFGDFVRQSLALGYRPLAYEITDAERSHGASRTDSIARREEAQADHLTQALAADPKAKVFVYVGFSHVAERPIRGWDGDAPISWMAARLKAKTGIDPLTIDQVTLGPDAGRDTGLTRRALAAKGLRRSTVLFNGDHAVRVGQYADAVDLQVYHPPVRMVKGRPDWLAAMQRKAMAIPARFVPQKGERLVQAFIATEREDAIPVDQVLVRAGEAMPSLFVPGDKPLRLAMQDPIPVPAGP
jgi:hypothetical protein